MHYQNKFIFRICKIITKSFKSNDDKSDVVLITYIDGDHEWSKSLPHEISTFDLIWEFF
jgi:hypothetical protein